METTLHRQLKALYAPEAAQQEVTVAGYRIDAIAEGRLIEIQHGSLGAIRDKVRSLLANHRVHVVKPIAARTYLVKRHRCGGRIESARYSPTRRSLYDLFEDLVHFVGVFPQPNLTLEVLLTEQEEHRLPAKSPRRWRRYKKSHRVVDRALRSVQQRHELSTAADLLKLLPETLSEPFATSDISREADIPVWLAQKMAYCLRHTGAAIPSGKQGNAILYRRSDVVRKAA